jgi:hypothetical protein
MVGAGWHVDTCEMLNGGADEGVDPCKQKYKVDWCWNTRAMQEYGASPRNMHVHGEVDKRYAGT